MKQLKIHFLNVGHGDCILIEFPTGRKAIVDINTTGEMDELSETELLQEALGSLSEMDQAKYKLNMISKADVFQLSKYTNAIQNPINYIQDQKISGVFRFISTHPHMDHLSGLKKLSDDIGFNVIWISKNKETNDLKKLSESQKEDWKFYKKYRDSTQLDLDGIRVLNLKQGNSNNFWKEDGITILAPDSELLKDSNANVYSYVLLIKYAGRKIVLGGDGENATWEYILKNHEDLIKDVTILKASHHGRDSGYHQKAVKHMNPEYTIVSVGKKPSTDASNKYKQYCENVWSTRWKGNIVFTINEDGSGSYEQQYPR
jgi:competence protein ComEC